MSSVPIKELKQNLAYWTEKAAKGESVHITKFNHPYIVLSPDVGYGAHWGGQVGKGKISSVIKDGSSGKWLNYLKEDRTDK